MCGIFGYISEKPKAENVAMFLDVAYLSESRGDEATGAAIVDPKQGKIIIEKAAIPSSVFIKSHLGPFVKNMNQANIVVGHTRKSTVGSPKNNHNNHPVEGEKWVVVHNGTCSTMDRIKGYPYKGEVDTEVLLSHVETYGIEKGLANIGYGSAGLALINKEELNSVYLWRHSEPIYLALDQARKTIFFASTKDILEEGLSNLLCLFSTFQIRELPSDQVFKISHSPLSVEPMYEIKVVKKWESSYNKKYDGYKHYVPPKTTFIWDMERQIWIIPSLRQEVSDKGGALSTRYYFPKQSVDFQNWTRLSPGGQFVSADRKLVKIFDHTKKVHFITSLDNALKEGLIEFPVIKTN